MERIIGKFTRHLVIGFFTISFAGSGLSMSQETIPWDSPEGIKRLSESAHKVDFFSLANHFEAQALKPFCGPTSTATVLNALRLRKRSHLPLDPRLYDERDLTAWNIDQELGFERYTQNNVFNRSEKPRAGVLGAPYKDSETGELLEKSYGFSLKDLSKLLKSHGASVLVRKISSLENKESLKAELIDNLARRGDFIIINYCRKTVFQPGGGHFSPLGAYDKRSDSFLVMDVNPNKAGWIWVKADLLLRAMSPMSVSKQARGYLMISEM